MVQPTPKQMTRDQKEAKVGELKQKMEDYPVVGVLDMHGLPAKQLQEIKKEMKKFAEVRMTRKTLMELAIDQADVDGVEKLKENDAKQPALIFSERDPFQLYSLIQRNKTSAAAQGGEEAPNDIEVPEGDTGIGPGPMLGKLQGAGLQVQVEDGTIHVQQPDVVVEKGEEITGDIAEILNQLGIEPLEIGLDLKIAFSEGEIFTAEQLDIDVEAYRTDVEAAASRAFNLGVNAGVINEVTAPAIVGEAARKARNLSISEGIATADTVDEILAYASSGAKALESQLDLEDVEIEEDEEEAGEDESDEEKEEDTGEGDSEDDAAEEERSEEESGPDEEEVDESEEEETDDGEEDPDEGSEDSEEESEEESKD